MASRQQEFVNQVYNEARLQGLPDAQARLAASQAALETGYGKSVVGNNYFGIKAGPTWTGGTVNARTWEDVGGSPVTTRSSFRSYSTPADSLNDWASTVGRRWSDALTAPTFEDAAAALNAGKSGGYATDRRYADKLGYINDTFSPDPRGILSVIDPVNVPAPSFAPGRASVTQVERSPLADIQEATPMADFNRANVVSPATFDAARFGDPVFDASRFGDPSAKQRQGLAGLQRGLLDQQLDVGILPEIPPAIGVSAQPSLATPTYAQQAQVQVSQPASMAAQPGMRSSPMMSQQQPQQQISQQQMDFAAKQARDQKMQGILGTVGGAVLGGSLLGPLGGLLGGYLGNTVAKDSYFPDAPQPIAGQGGGGSSYNDLSSYGRDVYSGSGDFRDAVNSGKGGLW